MRIVRSLFIQRGQRTALYLFSAFMIYETRHSQGLCGICLTHQKCKAQGNGGGLAVLFTLLSFTTFPFSEEERGSERLRESLKVTHLVNGCTRLMASTFGLWSYRGLLTPDLKGLLCHISKLDCGTSRAHNEHLLKCDTVLLCEGRQIWSTTTAVIRSMAALYVARVILMVRKTKKSWEVN